MTAPAVAPLGTDPRPAPGLRRRNQAPSQPCRAATFRPLDPSCVVTIHGQPNRGTARSTTRWRVWLPKRGRVTAWVKRHGGHREGHKADAEPDAFATEVSGRLSRR
jgi:hypothetical protein